VRISSEQCLLDPSFHSEVNSYAKRAVILIVKWRKDLREQALQEILHQQGGQVANTLQCLFTQYSYL